MIRLQLKHRFPIISLLLVISCLITSIPQLLLPPLYSNLTGMYPRLKSIYLITLPSFTHSPEIFINHLAGNLLVILIFGGLTEILLGSPRFALISLVTFLLTTIVNYFHSRAGGITHGASGICFGYILSFFFFLVITVENQKYHIMKHPITILSILLALFCIIGIPILEIVIFKQYLFQNFGQTIHLLSYGSVIPFLLVWRKDFEKNSINLIWKRRITNKDNTKKGSILLLVFILIINLLSTIYMVNKVHNYQIDTFTYDVFPENSVDIRELKRKIMIKFNQKVITNSEILIKKSITYVTENVPVYELEWIDEYNIMIRLSRDLLNTESLHLIYKVKREIFNGYTIEEIVNIEYGEI